MPLTAAEKTFFLTQKSCKKGFGSRDADSVTQVGGGVHGLG